MSKSGKVRCKVCNHPERGRIEVLIAGGASQSAVARKFSISGDSVHRHWRQHIDAERRSILVVGPVERQALASQIAEESSSVLDHFRAVRAGLYRLFSAALEAGDRNGGALVGGKLIDVNSAVAKLTGELANSPLVQHNTLNVIMESPQVQSFLQELAAQLKPFPDALRAVVAWMEARESSVIAAVSKPDAQASARPALEHQALEHRP